MALGRSLQLMLSYTIGKDPRFANGDSPFANGEPLFSKRVPYTIGAHYL